MGAFDRDGAFNRVYLVILYLARQSYYKDDLSCPLERHQIGEVIQSLGKHLCLSEVLAKMTIHIDNEGQFTDKTNICKTKHKLKGNGQQSNLCVKCVQK